MAKKSKAAKAKSKLAWRKWAVLAGLVLLSVGGWQGWKHRAALKALWAKKAAPVAVAVVEAVKEAPAKVAEKAADAEKKVEGVITDIKKVPEPKTYDAVLFNVLSFYSANQVIDDLTKAADDKDHSRELTLRITSPGGNAFAMFILFQKIEDLKKTKGVTLTCTADIMAASAAAILLETECDKRLATPRTAILFHGVQGEAEGNIAQMEDELKLMKILEEMTAPGIAKRLGMSVDEYLKWIYGRNRWLSPREALEMHAIDGIVEPMDTPAAKSGAGEEPPPL